MTRPRPDSEPGGRPGASTSVAFLHGHPDDECILTGGTIAALARQGHRVYVIFATDGAEGELPTGVTRKELGALRRREAAESVAVLGAADPLFLGYPDSGVRPVTKPGAPVPFALLNPVAVATALVAQLNALGVTALVGYDHHGNYGHPDHVQVHRVAQMVASLAPQVSVTQVTINRDHIQAVLDADTHRGWVPPPELDPQSPGLDGNGNGEPASVITQAVDVSQFRELKRRALSKYRSQPIYGQAYLELSRDLFGAFFDREWFIDITTQSPPGGLVSSLLNPTSDSG